MAGDTAGSSLRQLSSLQHRIYNPRGRDTHAGVGRPFSCTRLRVVAAIALDSCSRSDRRAQPCHLYAMLHVRHGTGSHFVTQRPSDPGIQRP